MICSWTWFYKTCIQTLHVHKNPCLRMHQIDIIYSLNPSFWISVDDFSYTQDSLYWSTSQPLFQLLWILLPGAIFLATRIISTLFSMRLETTRIGWVDFEPDFYFDFWSIFSLRYQHSENVYLLSLCRKHTSFVPLDIASTVMHRTWEPSEIEQ